MTLLLPLALAAATVAPSVEEMLAGLAASQQRAQAGRARVVYTQVVHAKLLRPNGKVAREETRTYTVTPKPDGFERKLEKLAGWLEHKGRVTHFSVPEFEHKSLDIDAHLMDELIDEWTGNQSSRDGIDREFFPLTAEHQQRYRYERVGSHALTFAPREKKSAGWKGDVVLDPETLSPRRLNSTFAFQIPRAVKVLFGISLRQVGLAVDYDKAIDGLWFPVSAGTEFQWRVLFGYSRTLTLSLKNSDFRLASAESTVKFDPVKE
ncbi:MAG: hypothetical protein IT162_21835 [Bryobacterales bacterium]|nr:hypothetical protein [Bryobacterales bacterium]